MCPIYALATVCEVPAEVESASSGGSTWRIQRIGPVESRGGNNFIIARDVDVFDLEALTTGAAGRVWIRSVFLAAVSLTTGAVLGYPPIHIHHSHLGPQ